jgi:hypothetical protein
MLTFSLLKIINSKLSEIADEDLSVSVDMWYSDKFNRVVFDAFLNDNEGTICQSIENFTPEEALNSVIKNLEKLKN